MNSFCIVQDTCLIVHHIPIKSPHPYIYPSSQTSQLGYMCLKSPFHSLLQLPKTKSSSARKAAPKDRRRIELLTDLAVGKPVKGPSRSTSCVASRFHASVYMQSEAKSPVDTRPPSVCCFDIKEKKLEIQREGKGKSGSRSKI